MSLLTAEDVAKAAGVEPSFVSLAVESGALGSAGKQAHFTAEDATRLRFLSAWDAAGLSVEKVGALIGRGELTFSFLAPSVVQGPLSTTTYEELAKDSGIGIPELQRLHEALGFDPPAKSDPIRPEDRLLANLTTTLLGSGSSEDAVLRLLRVYSASLRRIAQAEAELFESEIEEVMRRSGATEQDLLDVGGEVGRSLTSILDDTIHAIYRRHKQHVWLNHSITHIEMILESEGLYERLDRPPCVCFVDLTGYTTLTEQLGDQASAEMAARLGSLVENIARRFKGRPVKWLGDGGMFVFDEADAAVEAAIEMVEDSEADQLPPRHIGVHCGPVVFQDGDIYGRTVIIAARLSSTAGAGEVVVSHEIIQRTSLRDMFEDLGVFHLKGLAEPFRAYRVKTPR
jgi:adenylate cyclase